MRELTDTLKAAQKAGALRPLYKIVLTSGETTYTYERDRILSSSKHDEEMYSHISEIVLHNRDHALDDIDFKGYDAVISYGFGSEYSATASLSVIDQQFNDDPNDLTCTLFLEGIPNLMAKDEASTNYVPDEDDETPVKDLVDAIAGATLTGFTHCEAFEVVWEDGYDTLADSYKPRDGFRVYTGGSRLAAFRKALDYTANVPRFENDGKIHIMKPVTTGETYDSEYALGKGNHNFFKKAYRNSLVIPNRIYVKSYDDDDPQYLGSAQIDGYDSLPDRVKKVHYVQTKLESNDQADDIAEALITKAEMGCARGQAIIPINVGAEIFDYVKVTSSRQGDTRTGNIGYIHRRFGGDKWEMTFGFGNWLSALRYQNILKELETYTDAGNYFSRLNVKDLYAENLLAKNMGFYWIDPENNIDLDKIGDTLDNLPNGEVFAKVKSIHVDAEGGIKLDENILYSPGYDPTEKFDLNNNDFDDIPEGTVYRRTKSAALSASGMVLLDQVVVGTYGLVKKTDIYAGHIILGTAIADGEWYRETGISIDADKGIAAYGADMSFATFANRADYLAGNYQCKVDSAGAIVAAAGNIKFDSDGGHFKGEALDFYDTNGNLRGRIHGTGNPAFVIASWGDIFLHPQSSSYDIIAIIGQAASFRPSVNNYGNLGESSYKWNELYVTTVYEGDTIFANGWKLTETPDNLGMMLLRPNGSIAQEWR
jgi:hypothetical protein